MSIRQVFSGRPAQLRTLPAQALAIGLAVEHVAALVAPARAQEATPPAPAPAPASTTPAPAEVTAGPVGGTLPPDTAAGGILPPDGATGDPTLLDSMMGGLLPHDLSPFSMFMSADIVVKGVMIGLIVASVVTWTVWLAKTIEIAVARRRVHYGLGWLAAVRTLADGATGLRSDGGPVGQMVAAAEDELRLSSEALERDGIKERIALRLGRIEAAAGRTMSRGTGVLATIGSTAPFVGLFGTVWGIMNSFIGISRAQTTNLAVVAPGIAEALLATALGLVAAIPAVVIYNVFARQTAGYRAMTADASVEVMRLVSRDLDHGAAAAFRPAGRLQAAE